MADIKVKDSEYDLASKTITKFNDELNGCMQNFCTAINYVTQNAIRDDAVTSELYKLIGVSTQACNIFISNIQWLSTNFIAHIDNIDTTDTYPY
jgi:hypothetical protein